ncbi:hypothetical protein TNCV_4239951 [Trichonephila clavipes]|nr:hypothetical protein TNCV_4239951 [Trichonephila clavipes]
MPILSKALAMSEIVYPWPLMALGKATMNQLRYSEQLMNCRALGSKTALLINNKIKSSAVLIQMLQKHKFVYFAQTRKEEEPCGARSLFTLNGRAASRLRYEEFDSIVFSETIVCDLGVDTGSLPGFLTKTCQGFALKQNHVPHGFCYARNLHSKIQ